jgi:hypothetical protein
MSYFALQDDLEKLSGRPVDLVPKEGLHRSSAIGSWPTRRFCTRHDELYVADLADSTRAVREHLDGISRERRDEDRDAARRGAVPVASAR